MKKMYNPIMLVILLFIVGCATVDLQESLWQDTQTNDTINAYELYINKYPDSSHVSTAQNKIEELRKTRSKLMNEAKDLFNKWKESNDINAFNQLMQLDLISLSLTNEEMKVLFGSPDKIEIKGTSIFWTWQNISYQNGGMLESRSFSLKTN